jgi:hypothetical protein
MPGDPGNITNEVFGFCTRGCDCNDDPEAKLSDEDKASLLCLYPQGEKTRHHVVLKCASAGDCEAVDAGWKGCFVPETGAVKDVCHAHLE